tara:strand:- start:150 stop:569 length:420 start_codon:yes stop_codon:yes gene_type:complete
VTLDSYPEDIRILLARLSGLDLEKLPGSKEITTVLTEELVSWANENGWYPEREYKAGIFREHKSGKYEGRIDVYVNRDSLIPEKGLPPLAIEIDRGNKKWSIMKLEHLQGRGCSCLWIKWGKKIDIEIPDGIMTFHVPL